MREIDHCGKLGELADVTRPAGGCVSYTPTRRERFLRWFGYNRAKWPEIPPVVEETCPVWGASVTRITFSIWDRILLLFSGCLVVETRHQFQHDPGQIYTASEAFVKWRHDNFPEGK